MINITSILHYISNTATQQPNNPTNGIDRTMITSGNGSYAFTTMYVYGTRVYCAAEVDAAIKQLMGKNNDLVTTLHDVRANMQEIQTMYDQQPSSSDYWNTIALTATVGALSAAAAAAAPKPEPNCEDIASTLTNTVTLSVPVHENDHVETHGTHGTPDSPRSISSSAGGSLYGGDGCTRGRAVGKRNQDMYLPDGVKLSHVAGTEDGLSSEWIARFDKASNTIIREPDNHLKSEKVYETLKHFAREHDYATYGEKCSYIETVNVWKNQLFTFYDTVKCKWEPLSELR